MFKCILHENSEFALHLQNGRIFLIVIRIIYDIPGTNNNCAYLRELISHSLNVLRLAMF